VTLHLSRVQLGVSTRGLLLWRADHLVETGGSGGGRGAEPVRSRQGEEAAHRCGFAVQPGRLALPGAQRRQHDESNAGSADPIEQPRGGS
jgi:hypothetical protein